MDTESAADAAVVLSLGDKKSVFLGYKKLPFGEVVFGREPKSAQQITFPNKRMMLDISREHGIFTAEAQKDGLITLTIAKHPNASMPVFVMKGGSIRIEVNHGDVVALAVGDMVGFTERGSMRVEVLSLDPCAYYTSAVDGLKSPSEETC